MGRYFEVAVQDMLLVHVLERQRYLQKPLDDLRGPDEKCQIPCEMLAIMQRTGLR